MTDLIRYDFQNYPFQFSELWPATLIIFALGYVVTRRVLSNEIVSLIIPTIKSLIFFIYFFIYFDGTLTSGFDDFYYLSKGVSLINQVKDTPLHQINFFDAAEGLHFIYVIASAIVQYILGEGYYSLVALNIIISFTCGSVAYSIIFLKNGNKIQARLFAVSVMLYPDLIAFSSVFAGKDVLVLLAHLIILYSYLKILRGDFKFGYVVGFITFVSTVFLRFYVPIIFLFVIIYEMKIIKSISLIIPIGLLLWFSGLLNNLIDLFNEGSKNIIQNSTKILYLPYDILHFWLTPRPFFEDPIFEYTLLANIFNWLIFPIFIYGYYFAFKSKDKFVKFLCIYFLFFSIFYGLVDFLNGPRHRLQLIFPIIYFIWVGLGKLKLIPLKLRFYP
jgi:hypothetical protein